MSGYADKNVKKVELETPNAYNTWTDIFPHLTENADFRHAFVKRALMHMETTFDPSRVIEIIEKRYDAISLELPRHERRWGRTATTKQDLNDMKYFAQERPTIFLKQIKTHFPEQFE